MLPEALTFIVAELQVGGDDQAAAFVAFEEDLGHELGGAVQQREVAELIEDQQFGPGVATHHPGELAVALGFLELVGERGEGGEPQVLSNLLCEVWV